MSEIKGDPTEFESGFDLKLSTFICPITYQIFHTPVTASDGFTYEKEAIERYYEINKLSPMTRQELNGEFHVSMITKQLVALLLEQHPEYKEEQYVPQPMLGKTHANYKNEIYKIINNRQWNKLRNYTEYDVKSLRLSLLDLFDFCDIDTLKYVIDNIIDLDETVDESGRRLIHYIHFRAVNTPIIKYIIDKGVDLNVLDVHGCRPIYYACANSTIEIVEYMVDKGAYIDDKFIHYVCMKSPADIIKYFINVKNLDITSSYDGMDTWNVDPIHGAKYPVQRLFYNNNLSADEKLELIHNMCLKMCKERTQSIEQILSL